MPPAEPAPLTLHQRAVLKAIVAWVRRENVPPSVRALTAEMGYANSNGVYNHLKVLVRKGRLVGLGTPSRTRRLRLADADCPGCKGTGYDLKRLEDPTTTYAYLSAVQKAFVRRHVKPGAMGAYPTLRDLQKEFKKSPAWVLDQYRELDAMGLLRPRKAKSQRTHRFVGLDCGVCEGSGIRPDYVPA